MRGTRFKQVEEVPGGGEASGGAQRPTSHLEVSGSYGREHDRAGDEEDPAAQVESGAAQVKLG